MAHVTPSRINGIHLTVAGMLVVLGIMAYARVGGPLVIAGGLAIAAILVAYRRHREP